MEVITISSEAFKAIMQKIDRIDQKLDSNLIDNSLDKTWVDIQEAAFILRASKRTLLRYRNSGKLPYSRISGKIYFKTEDIQKFLEKNYHKLRR